MNECSPQMELARAALRRTEITFNVKTIKWSSVCPMLNRMVNVLAHLGSTPWFTMVSPKAWHIIVHGVLLRSDKRKANAASSNSLQLLVDLQFSLQMMSCYRFSNNTQGIFWVCLGGVLWVAFHNSRTSHHNMTSSAWSIQSHKKKIKLRDKLLIITLIEFKFF